MLSESKPLCALTIGEFIALTKSLLNEVLDQKGKDQETERKSGLNNEEHFNIGELAEFLKCSKVSVHKYKKNGLPFYRIGRKVLFKKSEVLDFMKKTRNKRVIQ